MATVPRVSNPDTANVVDGIVRWSPAKSVWFSAMSASAVIGGALTFSWGAFTVFVVFTSLVLLLGHSLGSHRKLVHDSFECPKWLEYFLVYCGVLVGISGPLSLLRTHDTRDFAQRRPDCHPYLRHGAKFAKDGWWQLHCDLRLVKPPTIQLEPKLAHDAFYEFLERTWMLQQLPWAVALYLIGGWGFVFWGVCARVAAGVGGHWLIGYFAHNHGGVSHIVGGAAVQGYNIPLVSLLTMGEGWHNNHHAFPESARLGLYKGEWDPGWWVLCFLGRLGLASKMKVPADLPSRSELFDVRAVRRDFAQLAWHR